MTIEVSGGAGGVGAFYQDLRAFAGVLDEIGDDVRSRSDDVGGVAIDSAVLAAALLCPLEVAAVEAAAVSAAVGPSGLLPVSVTLEGSALVLQATVESYEFIDEAQKVVLDRLNAVQGYLLGAALPFLAAGGVALIVSNPALLALLGMTAAQVAQNPEAALAALRTAIYENPWLMEELTESAPWLVQGLSSTLTGGPVLPFLLSGGRWPTASYEDSVGGLVNLGNLGGLFVDGGEFGVERLEGQGAAPDGVSDIFRVQSTLYAEESEGQIQITAVGNPPSYIVTIPGTQEWSPDRGASGSPMDLTSNVQLMAGRETLLQAQVEEAMRQAGIPADAPVMLTGHSQGGILCATMATDSDFMSRYNVTSIVTGGSPIARFDIPDSVSVLAVEHDQDPVPMLEGRENPDRANWVTVEADATAGIGRNPDPEHPDAPLSPEQAHGVSVYADTGRAIDSSQDPSLVAWREQNAHFFSGDTSSDRYQLNAPAHP